MISRVSSIISSHATAIPSDEGRVYSLVPKAAMPIWPAQFQKETYSDFSSDRFPKFAETALVPQKQDKGLNSSLHGYGMAFFAASLQDDVPDRPLYRLIIRA